MNNMTDCSMLEKIPLKSTTLNNTNNPYTKVTSLPDVTFDYIRAISSLTRQFLSIML